MKRYQKETNQILIEIQPYQQGEVYPLHHIRDAEGGDGGRERNDQPTSTGAGGKDTFISIIYPLPSIYKLMPIYRDFLLEQSLIIINNR